MRRTWWPCCQPEAHRLHPKGSRAEPQKQWRDVDDWALSASQVWVEGLEAGDLVAVVTFSEGRLEWGSLSQSSVCSTCATSSTGDRPATLRIVRSGSGGPLSTGHGRSRPAGWSCRCGPGPTQACAHVCVSSALQWPGNIPLSRILWSFKFWNPRFVGTRRRPMDSHRFHNQSDLGRGFPLCLTSFICNVAGPRVL